MNLEGASILSGEELISVIDEKMQDINENLDMMRMMMVSVIDKNPDLGDLNKMECIVLGKSKEKILRNAIKEAIDELEKSRKSFKSKRLEALRKKLTNVLTDSAA